MTAGCRLLGNWDGDKCRGPHGLQLCTQGREGQCVSAAPGPISVLQIGQPQGLPYLNRGPQGDREIDLVQENERELWNQATGTVIASFIIYQLCDLSQVI